jgi:hypothetical protein
MTSLLRALCASTLAACVFSVSAPANADPPSYRLDCMGGPSMRIMTNHDVPSPGDVGAIAMTIFFTAAPVAGSPGPGQCVWVDRAFRPGEPQSLWFRSANIEFAFQVTGDGRVVRDTTGARINAEGMTPEASNWSRVVAAVMDGRPFAVMVYNADNRVMNVTEILP